MDTKYKTSKNLTRKNRKPISYKITKPQVNTALELLKQNEQLTMNELAIDIKKINSDCLGCWFISLSYSRNNIYCAITIDNISITNIDEKL